MMTFSAEVDQIIAGAIERRIFPGAVVLVARDGALEHFAAYGGTVYDAPAARPVTRSTIYDIASLTKMFTATAALALLERGLLDLDAPAAAYLPELAARDVLVRHLLTHTSGLDIRLSALRHHTPADLMAAAYAARQAHPPGAQVFYSNINSLLLGEMVARRYGAPLDVAARELITAPLGLGETGFCPAPERLARIAPTELDEEWRGGLVHGSVHDESAHALGGVAGHAGMFSTALDLARFCQMWLGLVVADERPTASDQGGRQPDEGRRAEDEGRLGGEEGRLWSDEGRTTKDEGGSGDELRAQRVLEPTRAVLSAATARLACRNHTAGLNAACGLGWMLDRANFMGAAPQGSFGHTGFTGPAFAVVPARRLVVVLLCNRVYPRRTPPPYAHHAVTAAVVEAGLRLK
jgi:CubicO group peptidase (beta-lactamase class C family)